MFAPFADDVDAAREEVARVLALISFCVALGNAQSAGIAHSGLSCFAGRPAVKSTPGNCSAYS
jgi:hypothetical protein